MLLADFTLTGSFHLCRLLRLVEEERLPNLFDLNGFSNLSRLDGGIGQHQRS